jgi:heme/copper-type cytochrome/quinol oxidase subunit 1
VKTFSISFAKELILIPSVFYWIKSRVHYLINSWVYTTNHKRISINYLNFVLVAGTAGMSLATVIRLEFAYPGVGILAGDSLQYLSVATAHGVIMVFYMIMPAIFGAFGNFLLPTQLGVHDVAFPRLNSAAFWFLPGGVIMLFQLVCTDRRYARMNCFNIRELQGILKRKFFVDLIDSHDYKDLLKSSMINLRYKTNSNLNLDFDTSMFYKFGIHTTNINKEIIFYDNASKNIISNREAFLLDYFNHNNTLGYFSFLQNLVSYFWFFYIHITIILFSVPTLFKAITLTNILSFTWLSEIKQVLSNNFSILQLNFFESYQFVDSKNNIKNLSFNVSDNYNNLQDNALNTFSESSSSQRFTRFNNVLINYDYKTGNYIGNWDKQYPFLINSFIEVARGIRKPSWFFSEQYNELLKKNYDQFFSNFSGKSNLKLSNIEDWYSVHITSLDNLFNFYYILTKNNSIFNLRWSSFISTSQKYNKMFSSSSTQQRILGNWRQIKFTREAWRCKLLAARHQNTLYRRFLSEESLIYSIERNAKDLLPGWAMITPFSSRTRFTAIGRIDVGLMGVFLAINASIVSSANFLVTYRYLSTLNNRKMRDARSFFSESLIVASWMMVAANPMLAISILMLLSDRHWQTSFFDYSGGGDTVLFQHMFWFFGHPEVYIIMIPIFGFTNTIMSFYFRKRVSARASLMYSMYTIAFLGFFVWGHHMYMVGLSHTTRMLFSTLTVMISVPAATKLMHWCVTIVNSVFVMEIPLIFTFTFAFLFVCGGVSGMCVAHTGMDVLFHDTFYVIGHFHVMFASCAMIGIFAAIYFYFPALYGVKYSRVYAYIHYTYYFLGQLITIMPMLWLGYCGMPRRVLDYPASLGGWHAISSAGHLLSIAAILAFFIMIYDSIRQAKPSIRNNFGAGRLNTRLNFYFFEINRLSFLQKKNFYNNRFYTKRYQTIIKDNSLLNINNLDSTLFSYKFFTKNNNF